MSNYLQQDLIPLEESSQEDSLAKIYQSLVSEQDWKENALDFSGKSADSLTKQERKLLSSKMCLVYFQAITGETWPLSLKRWSSAGIASRGGCLMLNTSEVPKDGEESSLSDVLETQGDHLKKYSLSQRAAQGILRRATRRGKVLPPPLQEALNQVASEQSQEL